jgi:hypothetical protein
MPHGLVAGLDLDGENTRRRNAGNITAPAVAVGVCGTRIGCDNYGMQGQIGV